jgi:tetratricopeptide (TPR) repeat protein
LERQPDDHINMSELEAILRSRDRHFGFKEDDMPEARRHIDGCDFCRDVVSLHLEQGGRLAQLSRTPDTRRTSACPQESQWPELAAGLVDDDQAAELLSHAAACDHCGPLLRQSLEDFADDVTPAEEEFLAGLESAQPEWQERMASRLASEVRPGIRHRFRQLLRWLRKPPVDWIPVPAWAYAALAALVAVVVPIVTRPTPVASVNLLLAGAYTEQRPFELRIPQAAYGPLRVVKGSTGASHLDQPPALLESEARIARELDAHPNDPRWLQARGLAELLDRDFDSAIADFQQSLTLQPASTRLMIQLAGAHFERAQAHGAPPDYKTALDFLNQALKMAPDDPVALFNRAIVYERMQLYSQAIEDWRHYLKVDPNSQWAAEARKRLADVQQSESSSREPKH